MSSNLPSATRPRRLARFTPATSFAAIAVTATLAVAHPAAWSQQDRSALYTRGLAATCASCHGTDGAAVGASAVPALAGMPRDYMIAQMKSFKEGARPATVMHQIAKGYSDAQIAQLAGYFAAQKK